MQRTGNDANLRLSRYGVYSVEKETRRQLTHISLIAFAFLLRYLDRTGAAVCALLALGFNLTLLPRLVPAIFRPGEGKLSGITIYPFSVLLLVLFLPLQIAAAAWAVMAMGDGAATIIGKAVNGPRLPWNREKTLAGSLAFFLAAAAGAFLLYGWVSYSFGGRDIIYLALMGAFVGALVESLPLTIDDNLSVPLLSGAAMWLTWMATLGLVPGSVPIERLLLALAINLPIALAALARGQVSKGGFAAGLPVGVAMFCWSGWPGYLALVSFYLLANLATRAGYRRKQARGQAQEQGGRRGAKHALANCLVGLVSALAYYLTGDLLFMVALAAAFATAAFDTVSGELGQLFPGRPVSLLSFKKVPVGTSGAVSLGGTFSGLAAAALVALAPYLAGLLDGPRLAAVLIGATLGALSESFLSFSLEKRGFLDNEELNLINTLVGAVLACHLAGWL